MSNEYEPVSVEDWLPVDGTWVFAHYNGDNWGEDLGQYWVVAQFIRGLTIADREALEDTDPRKGRLAPQDEHDNNKRPFYWDQWGSSKRFGQDVDYWMAIPEIPRSEDRLRKEVVDLIQDFLNMPINQTKSFYLANKIIEACDRALILHSRDA